LKYFHQISDAQKELAEMEYISSSAELALAIDKMSNAPPHVMKVVAVSGGGWHLMLLWLALDGWTMLKWLSFVFASIVLTKITTFDQMDYFCTFVYPSCCFLDGLATAKGTVGGHSSPPVGGGGGTTVERTGRSGERTIAGTHHKGRRKRRERGRVNPVFEFVAVGRQQ
jgi:hypothetical protein